MNCTTMLSLSLCGLLVSSAIAKDTGFKEVLSHVPAAELPITAAKLVKDAKPQLRGSVTRDVVKTAVTLNPAAAPVIASAIAREVPEMASLAAATAAAAQPKQAPAIAKAAAMAAPSKAGLIVAAVCRVVPNNYRNVAVSVAQAVPGLDKDILNGVSSAFPELKSGIDRALAGHTSASVSYVLASTTPTLDQSPVSAPLGANPPLARGPVIGPPFIPLSQTPTNVTPGTSGNVPPGSRGGPTDYAQP